MERVLVNIGNKTYKCKVAKNEEDKRKGLQGVEHLPSDEGMLFIWNDEDTREMWMKDCSLELDIIGINDDEEVNTVYRAIPNDETLIPFPNAKYILEVNANSGINVDDEFEIDDADDLNKYVMKVLAPDGSTQFMLQSGERIVSRKETKTLIRKAKRAYENKGGNYNRYCKSLGKYIFKVLKGQDTRDPEYVTVTDKN